GSRPTAPGSATLSAEPPAASIRPRRTGPPSQLLPRQAPLSPLLSSPVLFGLRLPRSRRRPSRHHRHLRTVRRRTPRLLQPCPATRRSARGGLRRVRRGPGATTEDA